MPYTVRKRGRAYTVVVKRTGRVVAVRGSRKKAEASARARNAKKR